LFLQEVHQFAHIMCVPYSEIVDIFSKTFGATPVKAYFSVVDTEVDAMLFVNQLRELCSTVPACVANRSWLHFERITFL